MPRRFGLLTLGVMVVLAAIGLAAEPAAPECCGKYTLPTAAPPADAPKAPAAKKKYPRGHKHPSAEVLQKRHDDAKKRHGERLKNLPKATPATYDLRTLNRTGPIQDQAQCGSCWDVSACGVCTDAFIASGQFSNTDATKTLSPQYVLDGCGGPNGGCNGDDAPTVLDMCKSRGLPTTADYGPYVAAPRRCNYTNQKLYQIANWGFCTPAQEQGVANTQDIKNALVQYGTISTAVAADDSWDTVGADGVIPYENSNQIDHDVAIVGWDDNKQIPGAPQPGAWIVKNQWGTSWGANGYCWLAYGSHSIGTEAAWVTTGTLPPPPTPNPPTPSPPTPGPTPPTPGPFTGTITTVETYQNGVSTGKTVIIGNPTNVGDDLKTAGVSPAVIVDVMQLLADLKARAGVAVIAADVLKIIADISTPAK